MKIDDYEIFRYGENFYTPFFNNGKTYNLNKSPYLDIVLTDRCNSNCGFCIADLIHKKLDIDIEMLKDKVLFAVENLNVKEVLILGGEPTVSPILLDVLDWLGGLGLSKIVMTTNGLALKEGKVLLDELAFSSLTNVNLSLMSVQSDKQLSIGGRTKSALSIQDVRNMYSMFNSREIGFRINTNVFSGNNDTADKCFDFYNATAWCCDSVKFSPLFAVDEFSVINTKTEWVKQHILSQGQYKTLFEEIEKLFSLNGTISVIENHHQFGFVKNSMIPLRRPVILNWNFGDYTGMAKRVKENNEINNIKLLPNGELSLSWNREAAKFYIKTN